MLQPPWSRQPDRGTHRVLTKGLTLTQFIWREWQANPDLFHREPCHLTSGPYSEQIPEWHDR